VMEKCECDCNQFMKSYIQCPLCELQTMCRLHSAWAARIAKRMEDDEQTHEKEVIKHDQ